MKDVDINELKVSQFCQECCSDLHLMILGHGLKQEGSNTLHPGHAEWLACGVLVVDSFFLVKNMKVK